MRVAAVVAVEPLVLPGNELARAAFALKTPVNFRVALADREPVYALLSDELMGSGARN